MPTAAGASRACRAPGTLHAVAMNLPAAFAAAGCLAALLLALALSLAQADYAREKRWANEITPGIVGGEAMWIELKSGRKFLAIYAPNPKAGPVSARCKQPELIISSPGWRGNWGGRSGN